MTAKGLKHQKHHSIAQVQSTPQALRPFCGTSGGMRKRLHVPRSAGGWKDSGGHRVQRPGVLTVFGLWVWDMQLHWVMMMMMRRRTTHDG